MKQLPENTTPRLEKSRTKMTWNERYVPPESNIWQGRIDAPATSSFFQTIKLLNLLDASHKASEEIAFGLIGFASDEGIRRNLGRVGAMDGPRSIRHTLAPLPIHIQDRVIYDAGNITCEDGNLENAQSAFSEAVAKLLSLHITPIGLGGGHEIAWGHYQGLLKRNIPTNIAIVNFDAHFDLRPLTDNQLGTSGTPFLQIAKTQEQNKHPFNYYCIGIIPTANTTQLFDTAKQYKTHILFADEFQQKTSKQLAQFIEEIIAKHKIIYVSLCLDVFAAPFAPGVSSPQVLGLTPWQVIPLIRQLAASGHVISYDVAELSPLHDIDHRTAKLAASFIYEIIHHHKRLLIK